jgi:membrane fusion protein, multidrug efflux system
MAVQKRYVALVVLGGLIIVGSIAAYVGWKHSEEYVRTDNAYINGDIYNVSFKTSGKVKEIFVKENAKVNKGEKVALLEPEDYDLAVKTQEGRMGEATTQVFTSEAQISQAKANVMTIESQLELARIEKKRAEALIEKESIPKQKYDQAITSEKVLSAQLEAAKKAMDTAVASLKTSQEKVKTSEAALESANLVRSYCELLSPVDGIVTKKTVEAGQVVQAGQPICAVVPLEAASLWIEANYKETQLKRVRPGQKVVFWTDIDKSMEFEGEVESLSPGTGVVFSLFPAENATGNWVKIVQRVPVKIRIKPGQEGLEMLRLGVSVTCEIDTTDK